MIAIEVVEADNEENRLASFESTAVPEVGDLLTLQFEPGAVEYTRWKIVRRDWEVSSNTGKPLADDPRAKLRTVWLRVVLDQFGGVMPARAVR